MCQLFLDEILFGDLVLSDRPRRASEYSIHVKQSCYQKDFPENKGRANPVYGLSFLLVLFGQFT
jgi:hypothetical protein